MLKKIFKLLALLMVVAAIAAIAVYAGSLDWSRAHTNRVAALPLYTAQSSDGDYRVSASGFEFRARMKGMQNQGENLILLHGFPESSIMWNDLAASLAEQGFRVLAYDQRGYSPGARPSGVEAYEIEKLAADVFAMADAVGFERFHLVGHDWGAVVGWHVVTQSPARIQTWTGMAIPHITTFFEALLDNPDQIRRSAYMDRLRRPFIPEFVFLSRNQHYMRQLMHRLAPEQLAEYQAILSEPGAFTSTLNWYRALHQADYLAKYQTNRRVRIPTLFIWGTNDGIISPSVVDAQVGMFDAGFEEVELPVGHNPVQQSPGAVREALLNHVRSGAIPAAEPG